MEGMNQMSKTNSKLIVYCGSMFSGKTTALIKDRLLFKKQRKNVVVIKPKVDSRYSGTMITTHDNVSTLALVLDSDKTILCDTVINANVVLIDEVQFFKESQLVSDINYLMSLKGKTVIVAGLDLDSKGIPFDTTAKLMAMADNVFKFHTQCGHCKTEQAWVSARKQSKGIYSRIQIGGSESYVPLCRKCFLNFS